MPTLTYARWPLYSVSLGAVSVRVDWCACVALIRKSTWIWSRNAPDRLRALPVAVPPMLRGTPVSPGTAKPLLPRRIGWGTM